MPESERKSGKERERGKAQHHTCSSDRIRANLRQPHRPSLIPIARDTTRASAQSIRPVGGPVRFDRIRFRGELPVKPSRTVPSRAGEATEVVGCGARHGGPRRRIGVEGRRLGRRPGRGMGLAQHPAAPLLRLPLPLLRSRGCFGCCDKTVKQVGELSKSLLSQDQNPTIGEEFWSTSTIEIDQADLRGVSSINTSTRALDQHGPVGSSHSPPEFVNHGLFLWKQNRQEWTDNRRQQPKVKQIHEPILSWNAAYESLLGSNKPFSQPIPLHEMVDFLVDIWEQEGLYD